MSTDLGPANPFGDDASDGDATGGLRAGAGVPSAGRVRGDDGKRGPNFRLLGAIGLIAAAMGILLYQGLGNATVYFRTADEAVAQHDKLGTKRFRVEGIVADAPATTADGKLLFHIESNGARIEVLHDGKAPGLFKESIPVVLEGHFLAGSPVYSSDRILVKHTEQYRQENPDRTKDYTPTTVRP